MIIKEQCVCVGFISKPHGVKGEVSVMLNDGFYSEGIQANFLLLDIDNGLVPFAVESLRIKSNKSFLVQFEDVNSEEDARKLTGIEVYQEALNVKEDEGAQMGALIGYEVVDQKAGNIGVITNVNEISNNPLFEIDCDGTEVLIPIHPDLILGIDSEERIVDVNLPEGLLDVYLGEEEDDERDGEEWDKD